MAPWPILTEETALRGFYLALYGRSGKGGGSAARAVLPAVPQALKTALGGTERNSENALQGWGHGETMVS